MKPIKILINDYRLLYSAALASAEQDARFFLLGVLIQKAPKQCGGGLVYIGTNGHRLTVAYDENAKATNLPPGGAIVRTDNVKSIFPNGKFKQYADLTSEIILDKTPNMKDPESKAAGKITIAGIGKVARVLQVDARFPHFVEVIQKTFQHRHHNCAVHQSGIDFINKTVKVFSRNSSSNCVVHFRFGVSRKENKNDTQGILQCFYYDEFAHKLPVYSLLMPFGKDDPVHKFPDYLKGLEDSFVPIVGK